MSVLLESIRSSAANFDLSNREEEIEADPIPEEEVGRNHNLGQKVVIQSVKEAVAVLTEEMWNWDINR